MAFNGFTADYNNQRLQYARTPQATRAILPAARRLARPHQGAPYDDIVKGPLATRTQRDPSMQNPRCVLQIVKRHYSRYTPEMVESATGCPKETVPQSRRDHACRVKCFIPLQSFCAKRMKP